MSKILDYLNEVDANAKLKALHEADPEGTMKSYGLTDAEIKALLCGDCATVAKLSGAGEGELQAMQTPHVVYK